MYEDKRCESSVVKAIYCYVVALMWRRRGSDVVSCWALRHFPDTDEFCTGPGHRARVQHNCQSSLTVLSWLNSRQQTAARCTHVHPPSHTAAASADRQAHTSTRLLSATTVGQNLAGTPIFFTHCRTRHHCPRSLHITHAKPLTDNTIINQNPPRHRQHLTHPILTPGIGATILDLRA